MTPPVELQTIAFDPGANLAVDGETVLSEVTLSRVSDGRFLLEVESDDGRKYQVALAPDFLDEFVAQARARQADAA